MQYNFKLKMNFFKKMMGFQSDDLKTQILKSSFIGTFYRVIKDTRNIIFPEAQISFQQEMEKYFIKFNGKTVKGEVEEIKEYAFPIHIGMDLVTFTMKKNDKVNSCFEWQVDQSGDYIGCYMKPEDQEKFQDLICKILKVVMDDQHIKDHMKLCKSLNGIPVYKKKQGQEQSSKSSKLSSKAGALNDVLIKEASKKQNKMVFSGEQYEIVGKERKLVKDSVVFVLKNIEKFVYEFQLINAAGFTYLRKELTPGLIYEVNTDLAYIKWLHVSEGYKIVEVNFEGKRDAAMSVKFAILQCLYEMNTKRKIQDAIAEDQIAYVKRISEKTELNPHKKIVKTYEDQKSIELDAKKFVYGNDEAEKGLEKYRTFCQGKIHPVDIASLGSMLQVLKISEDNSIKRVQKKKVKAKDEINFDSLILHDNDTKVMMRGDDGKLYYYDLNKAAIIENFDLSNKGVNDICPEFKLAETVEFKTFKAVSPNSIYEVDPRVVKGLTNSKIYQTNPEFNHISCDEKGKYAVSSSNGQIRLYDKIGKNANCKYPGLGDPVLHLDSTKDGQWLLATFKNYLILLPTETEDEISLYEQKIKIDERPRPIKLTIKLEHLQMCKVQDLKLIPGKFDERKGGREKYIVSGFGEYAVVWNLANVIRGNLDSYKFTHVNEELVQADFRYNNLKKLIMTTVNGITIQENKG